MLAGMLTEKDISTVVARVVAVVATKEDIRRVEERLAALEENLNRFVTASEKFTGAFQDLKLEYAAVSTQLSRHEEWIKKLAEKTGVTLNTRGGPSLTRFAIPCPADVAGFSLRGAISTFLLPYVHEDDRPIQHFAGRRDVYR
jgi:siroheme synthase (precorrin-2 oxidase/ferrochelatase)